MSDESLEGAKAFSRRDAESAKGSTTLRKEQEARAILSGLGPAYACSQAGLERVTTSGREDGLLSFAVKRSLPTLNSKEPTKAQGKGQER